MIWQDGRKCCVSAPRRGPLAFGGVFREARARLADILGAYVIRAADYPRATFYADVGGASRGRKATHIAA